ncbi:MAG: hypothetical protein HKO57_08765, partial [Akkermansiaceae bacterium]|nr:hypothetical protein [Akkermansiaceae bacterium]
MKRLRLTSIVLALGSLPLAAQLIGTDDFSYADTTTVFIADKAGGTGFNYDNFDGVATP